jgi:RNase H-fold protein (predicted Holliday junction resolvase)
VTQPPQPRGKYVGIDPGSAKCGFAVVDEGGATACVEVVPAAEIAARIDREVRSGGVRAICVGHATTSGAMVRTCRATWPEIPLHVVDETNTTMQARDLYYAAHPPKGLLRFVPRGLLVPPEPLDGYAALLIIKRFLRHGASGGAGDAPPEPPQPSSGQGEESPEVGKKSGHGVHPAEGFVRHRPG